MSEGKKKILKVTMGDVNSQNINILRKLNF